MTAREMDLLQDEITEGAIANPSVKLLEATARAVLNGSTIELDAAFAEYESRKVTAEIASGRAVAS